MVNINHGLYLQGDFVYIHNTGRIKRVIYRFIYQQGLSLQGGYRNCRYVLQGE